VRTEDAARALLEGGVAGGRHRGRAQTPR
jgi:hypothetical protein